MGFVSKDEALAKGPIVRALDEVSTRNDARQILTTLKDNIKADVTYPFATDPSDETRPDFPHLTNVLKDYLLTYWSGVASKQALDDMANYLDRYWFGDQPREYAGFPTRGIYGMGLLKAIDSSLRGQPAPRPIDAYWYIHADRFEVISLESPRQVTLLISTPTPVSSRYAGRSPMGACEAWVTATTDKDVGLEVSPPDLNPSKPIDPNDPQHTGVVTRHGYRICTYKIVGGV
jgi:hypothetical protein